MQREFSAGGIVYQDDRGQRKWLVAQHSQHKGWVFPKGLIADHKLQETGRETAVREVTEETGITGRIIEELKPVTYFYTWQGEKRFKTVTYFLMEYVSGDTADHDWEMSHVEWLLEDKVKERLSFKSDKMAFAEALEKVAPVG